MFNEVLRRLGFNVLNKLFGNCKLFGIDKHLQASFLSVYTNNSKENE